MLDSLAVAIPSCSSRREDIRIGYVLEALAMQPKSVYYNSLDIYIWDEGSVPLTDDRWVRLSLELLIKRGHNAMYLRRGPSKGVAEARHNLLQAIPAKHKQVLFVDDDLLVMPGAIDALLQTATEVGKFGFIQGTKIELDATRIYQNDINKLVETNLSVQSVPLLFGDAAFLLLNCKALCHVDWDIITQFSREGLPGEDVALTLMISDHEPCFGVPGAAGYHMSLATPRWSWELPSDLLQLELLKPVVSARTLKKALPHLSEYLDAD